MRKGIIRKAAISGLTVLILSTVMLTGCNKDKDSNNAKENVNNNKEVNSSNKEESSENTEDNTKDKQTDAKKNKFDANNLETDKLFDTESDCYVVMIGNSLLQKGEVAKRFQNIATSMGSKVTAEGEFFMGKSLAEIADFVNETSGLEYVWEELAEADVVVLQEYGGYYETTLEDMNKYIDTYCKDDVTVYYYSTEFDTIDSDFGNDYMQEYQDAGINVLLTCQMLEKLNEEFGSDYFHLADYHPNELSGYCSALFMYSKLYKVSASDVPLSAMDEEAYSLMPGNSDEEKSANYDKITSIIDEING